MNIPRFELTKGFDVTNSPPDNPQNPETFRASTVRELLDHTLTESKVISSWGLNRTLPAALLAGAQGNTECMGENSPPLPTEPDKSLVNTMIPQVYSSQAGRRS
jgi:hypothetical protein